MSTWTIKEQENVMKSALFGASFLACLTGVLLLKEISLHWFNQPLVSDLFGMAILVPLFFFLRNMWREPKLLSYGWRLRELCGDFRDEYLRSSFQRATTLAFQLMMITAFLGFVATDIIIKYAESGWISHRMVPLLTVFVGNLGLYLGLHKVLDDQDDTAEESQ